MCIQETFVDAVRLSGLEELAASHGIFPRDPTLKDFLREKPACLVHAAMHLELCTESDSGAMP